MPYCSLLFPVVLVLSGTAVLGSDVVSGDGAGCSGIIDSQQASRQAARDEDETVDLNPSTCRNGVQIDGFADGTWPSSGSLIDGSLIDERATRNDTSLRGSYSDPRTSYARRAAVYDAQVATASYSSPRLVAEKLAELQLLLRRRNESENPHRILDIGAGTGLVGRELSFLGYQNQVLPMDISPEMLDQLKLKNYAAYVDDFVVADMNHPEGAMAGLQNYDALVCVGTTTYMGTTVVDHLPAEGTENHPAADVQHFLVDRAIVRRVLLAWLFAVRAPDPDGKGGLLGLTLRKAVLPSWTEVFHELETEKRWRLVYRSGEIPYLPTHQEEYIRKETIKIFFFEKLGE